MAWKRSSSHGSDPAERSCPTRRLLEVRDLRKVYDGRAVVDGVDLEMDRGEIVALVGPNGAGKTTTMECLIGLRETTEGTVRILGQDPSASWRARRLFGVQLQESGLPARLRVQEAFAACAALYDSPRSSDELIEQLSLTAHRRIFYEQLSGGLKRRVNIGLALLGDPPLAVLDEPTTGIDPEARGRLWDFLRSVAQAGTGILLSTHGLDEAEDHADRLVIMDQGRVVCAGPVEELVAEFAGFWRLRVDHPTTTASALLEERCDRVSHDRDRTVAFGLPDEVRALRRQLEGHDRSDVGYRNLVCGPVRLEDLYLRLRQVQR